MLIRNYREVEEKIVEEEEAKGVRMRRVIAEEDGAPHFIMRLFEVAPDGYTPLHSHEWEHEVFILSGEGEVTGSEGKRRVKKDDVVFVCGNEIHQFRNIGEQPFKFICLIPRLDK